MQINDQYHQLIILLGALFKVKMTPLIYVASAMHKYNIILLWVGSSGTNLELLLSIK